ncbi:MAG: hypothetical protein QOK40_3536 [Miltoncostaeaceae bacterium]|jgi:hypothetical protein|nr:hypothetical protein [Miltoncostaeaceae bacterium]
MFKNGKLPGRAGADRAAEMVGAARPLVKRAVTDKELQETARRAYDAGRRIYEELWGQSPQKAADKIARDKDLQHQVGEAVRSMRDVVGQLGRQPQRRGGGKRVVGLLVVGGGAAALLLSPMTGPKVRGWIKGRLGGGDEEEFTWSPPGSNAAVQDPTVAAS